MQTLCRGGKPRWSLRDTDMTQAFCVMFESMFSMVLLHDTDLALHDTSFLCRFSVCIVESRDTDRVCRFFTASLVAFTCRSVVVVELYFL